jgi:hypothetical protein
VLVIGLTLAAMLLTRHPNASRVAGSTRADQVTPAKPYGLAFGLTPEQIIGRTGQPTKTQGRCMFFSPTRTGTVGSISVQPSWSRLPYDPTTTGELKLCFAGGGFSDGYLRVFDPNKHKWVWSAWPLTLMHGTTDSDHSGV